MPYRLEVIKKRRTEISKSWDIVDCEDDGRSELLGYPDPNYTHNVRPMLISTFEFFDFGFHSLGLFNLKGGAYINGVLLGDIRPQKGKELLISAGKGNHVGFFLFNPQDSLCQKFPLYTHTTEDTSWKGLFVPAGLCDVNGDGRKDLITFMQTSYYLYPRGVLVTDLRDGSVIWRFDTGTLVGGDYYIVDLDGDGREELVLGSGAPANGAFANGTDDYHSYLIILDLRTGKKKLIKAMGPSFSAVLLLDVVPQKGKIYFVLNCGGGDEPNRSFIACLSYPDTTLRIKVPLRSPIDGAKAWDFDGDGIKEFVIARADKRDILVFDAQLKLRRQQAFQYASAIGLRLVDIADVNHDFEPEIITYMDARTTLLDRDLKPMAQFPAVFGYYLGLFYKQADEPPLIVVKERVNESTAYLSFLRLRRQFIWLLPIPWQAMAGFLIGILLFGAVLAVRRSLARKSLTIRSLQHSLERAPYGVLLLDRKGLFTFCNQTARRQLNLEGAVMEGRNFRQVLAEESLEPLRRLLEDSFQGPAPQLRQSLSLPAGPSGVPSQVVIWISRVYDDRRREQGRLVILYDPALEPERWQREEWMALARRIAHEIKNPLSTMMLTLQRLQMEYRRRDPENTPRYEYFTRRIMERIEDLEKLALGFLKLLKMETPRFQPCSINRLLEDLLREFELGLPEGIRLETRLAPNLPSIQADPELIRSLVENLLTNAIHAMPEGGVLTVSTSLEQNLLAIKGASQTTGNYILIRIRDTGRGMPEEVKKSLLDPHFSEKPEGIGLGLTIVKKIVKMHNGFIDVHSEKNVGTTVDVYLPA